MEEYFANLRIPEREQENKLTRAISYSEIPSARRICVQQRYESGCSSTGLIRQYSFEHISDKKYDIRKVNFSVINSRESEPRDFHAYRQTSLVDNTFKIPQWPPCKSNILRPSKLNQRQDEHMEIENIEAKSIDLKPSPPSKSETPKEHSPAPLPSDYCDTIKLTDEETTETKSEKAEKILEYGELKKKLRPLVPLSKSEKPKGHKMCRCTVIFFVLLPILFVLVSLMFNSQTLPQFEPDESNIYYNTAKQLKAMVYGQDKAIDELSRQLFKNNQIKILGLVGGTGVGKSHTVNVISEYFPYQDHIYTVLPPLYGRKVRSFVSPSHCNLIIVENLKGSDLSDAIEFLKPLTELENRCAIAIAIFNFKRSDGLPYFDMDLPQQANVIRTAFNNDDIPMIVIPFEPLTKAALDKCIEDSARISGLQLNESETDHVRAKLLESNSGCKGAYAKVQLYGHE